MFSISIVLKYNHTHSIYIFIKLGLLWRLSIEYYSTNFPLFIGHFSAYRQFKVFEVILFSLSSDFIRVLTVKNQPFVFCTNRTFNFFLSKSLNQSSFILFEHGSGKPPNYIHLHFMQYLDCCQKSLPSDTVHEMFEPFKIDWGLYSIYVLLLSWFFSSPIVYRFKNIIFAFWFLFYYRKERRSKSHGRV